MVLEMTQHIHTVFNQSDCQALRMIMYEVKPKWQKQISI